MAGVDDQASRGGRVARARSRVRWLAASLVVATVALSACQAGSHSSLSAATPGRTDSVGSPGESVTAIPATTSPSTVPASTIAPTTTPSTTTPKAIVPTTAAANPSQSGTGAGSSGPVVVQLQQRLSSLGYWLGSADGQFGLTTSQAVIALQKAAGLPRTGVVDTATASALAAGITPKPHSSAGHVIEVDLAHQLLLIVTDGHLDATLHTSTGGGYKYVSQGVTSVAITPVGHFTTNWQVDGTRVSPLGVLWRPKFFVGGIAIHGDGSVPTHPASHGCVRVSNEAINWIWATGVDPIGTSVWVY